MCDLLLSKVNKILHRCVDLHLSYYQTVIWKLFGWEVEIRAIEVVMWKNKTN